MSRTTDRIVEVSDGPAHLHVKMDQLVIERNGECLQSVPIEDMAVLILSTPSVTVTRSVLSGMASHNGVVIVCDDRWMPCSMALPIAGHSLHAKRLRNQMALSVPRRKRLWQQIVRSKIRAQARVLESVRGDSNGLIELCSRVRSGDPANVEAEAARRYWAVLFGADFRRNPDGSDAINPLLNYGYAVMRGFVARAIVAAGLHPALGLHHHNRENSFALADDLLEPLRPLVDEQVAKVVERRENVLPLDRETKTLLLSPIFARYRMDNEVRTLPDCLTCLLSSLVKIIKGNNLKLKFPETCVGVEE